MGAPRLTNTSIIAKQSDDGVGTSHQTPRLSALGASRREGGSAAAARVPEAVAALPRPESDHVVDSGHLRRESVSCSGITYITNVCIVAVMAVDLKASRSKAWCAEEGALRLERCARRCHCCGSRSERTLTHNVWVADGHRYTPFAKYCCGGRYSQGKTPEQRS